MSEAIQEIPGNADGDGPKTANPRPIFIVSDSTGDTAEAVVRAGLAQFDNYLVNVKTYAHVSDERRIDAVIRLAVREGGMIVHTLVDSAIRSRLIEAAGDAEVDCVDLIGALLGRLSSHLGGLEPREIPGLKTQLGEEYFRRIEAVEFTVKHDDGAEPRHLHKADIILVGVSRTSKTPLSTYLAQKGWKVANVPIVMGIDLPPELFQVDQDKIFGLTIEPEVLLAIRMARIRNLGLNSNSSYGNLEHIYMELEGAHETFRGNPMWPVVDVTHRAVEESAGVILKTLHERRAARIREQTIRG
jgi:regulator of PEP synthase PpsR (kinase-PPPase family)